MTDPHPLDGLAEFHAVNTAPHLAWAVHTRDAGLIAELLEPLDCLQLRALAVALAEQVPQPRTRPSDGIVDEVVVQRAADGQMGPLTRAERAETVRVMHRRGVPVKQICERLHMTYASVQRVLAVATDSLYQTAPDQQEREVA